MVRYSNKLRLFVKENYAVGEVESLIPVATMINDVWYVRASNGEYILKTTGLSREMLSVAHRLIAFLQEHNFPLSQPVRTHSGTTQNGMRQIWRR